MEPQILELRNLKAQRDALDKQIEEASKKAREDALNICRELIKEYDFAPQELGLKKAMKRANSIAPKFIGPNGETWAGRGRKPLWLQQAEEEGQTAEDFRILPHSFEPRGS